MSTGSGAGSETKMNLKILVDTNKNKVVFAEAGKEFVDFIFQIMSLPLSTVSKLLNEKGSGVGCLGTLYKSIETLNAQYYEPKFNQDSVLKPRATVTTIPLLSLDEFPTTITYYRCGNHGRYVSDRGGVVCPTCSYIMKDELSFVYVAPKIPLKFADVGYVKGAVPYIVMDNLEVKPMSISLIKSLVKDFDSMDEQEVQVGRHEGLALLKASLEKQAVLTSVFLRKKN